ncbi:MAG: acyltransferase, partial [Mycobacterium sp.]
MRAVAVGLVVLYHGFHAPFTGGFVGVDVFFVISGFLITNLLLQEKVRTERISIS